MAINAIRGDREAEPEIAYFIMGEIPTLYGRCRGKRRLNK